MSHNPRCPYCRRRLHPYERYCWFCEQDISKTRDDAEKPRCFIATAVFGGKSSEVFILRKFRDERLQENLFGRLFISGYYAISPPIARFVEKRKALKRIFRKAIQLFIRIFRLR